MKTASVKIVGKSPLLMNRRPLEDPESDGVKKAKATTNYDPKEDAEKKSYLDPKIGYYIPSDMIEACLREAGKQFIKKGRTTYKDTMKAAVFCEQVMIPLNRKDYDTVDRRYGTHPSTGNSVLVSRVRFDQWSLEFDLTFDETRIDEKTLNAALVEGGAVVAIGSYKPKFGRFTVEKFEVK